MTHLTKSWDLTNTRTEDILKEKLNVVRNTVEVCQETNDIELNLPTLSIENSDNKEMVDKEIIDMKECHLVTFSCIIITVEVMFFQCCNRNHFIC